MKQVSMPHPIEKSTATPLGKEPRKYRPTEVCALFDKGWKPGVYSISHMITWDGKDHFRGNVWFERVVEPKNWNCPAPTVTGVPVAACVAYALLSFSLGALWTRYARSK